MRTRKPALLALLAAVAIALGGCAQKTDCKAAVSVSAAVRSSAVSVSSAASAVSPVSSAQAAVSQAASSGTGHVVCIDPGHQKKVDTSTEPIAPGASVMKMKNPGGAEGVDSRTPEYEINLQISKKIQALLLAAGDTVVMTRENNDVDLTNIDRAQMANAAGADVFVRIHADSADSAGVSGISVQIPKAGYITDQSLIDKSKTLGGDILDSVVSTAGRRSRGLVPRDDMTGFNWSKVPVVLVETGFLSNPEEDALLNTGAYQDKVAAGVAEGIRRYLAGGA